MCLTTIRDMINENSSIEWSDLKERFDTKTSRNKLEVHREQRPSLAEVASLALGTDPSRSQTQVSPERGYASNGCHGSSTPQPIPAFASVNLFVRDESPKKLHQQIQGEGPSAVSPQNLHTQVLTFTPPPREQEAPPTLVSPRILDGIMTAGASPTRGSGTFTPSLGITSRATVGSPSSVRTKWSDSVTIKTLQDVVTNRQIQRESVSPRSRLIAHASRGASRAPLDYSRNQQALTDLKKIESEAQELKKWYDNAIQEISSSTPWLRKESPTRH